MDELLKKLNDSDVRFILIGGQAMRLIGMPRYSMDWDFFNPPRDESNLRKLNDLLGEDIDLPLEPLGPRGVYSDLPNPMGDHSVSSWSNWCSEVPRSRSRKSDSVHGGRHRSSMSRWSLPSFSKRDRQPAKINRISNSCVS